MNTTFITTHIDLVGPIWVVINDYIHILINSSKYTILPTDEKNINMDESTVSYLSYFSNNIQFRRQKTDVLAMNVVGFCANLHILVEDRLFQ